MKTTIWCACDDGRCPNRATWRYIPTFSQPGLPICDHHASELRGRARDGLHRIASASTSRAEEADRG